MIYLLTNPMCKVYNNKKDYIIILTFRTTINNYSWFQSEHDKKNNMALRVESYFKISGETVPNISKSRFHIMVEDDVLMW